MKKIFIITLSIFCLNVSAQEWSVKFKKQQIDNYISDSTKIALARKLTNGGDTGYVIVGSTGTTGSNITFSDNNFPASFAKTGSNGSSAIIMQGTGGTAPNIITYRYSPGPNNDLSGIRNSGNFWGPAATTNLDYVNKGQLDLKDNINTYSAKTTNYTLLPTDYTIDFTTGTNTATLPNSASNLNKKYIIKNSGTGSTIISPFSGQTIDGISSLVLFNQNSTVLIQSDGANWKILDSYNTTSVINTTINTAQTAATLNSAYPNAGLPFTVFAPNVGTGMVYIKTTSGGQWMMYSGSLLNP